MPSLKRIRIGAMSVTTTATTMVNGFDDFGTIVTSSIEYGANSATGHIEYTQDSEGQAAINAMNGARFDGAIITVTMEP